MSKFLLAVWCIALLFLGFGWYFLYTSDTPVIVKILLTVISIAVWIVGMRIAVVKFKEHEHDRREQERLLNIAKRILNSTQSKQKSE